MYELQTDTNCSLADSLVLIALRHHTAHGKCKSTSLSELSSAAHHSPQTLNPGYIRCSSFLQHAGVFESLIRVQHRSGQDKLRIDSCIASIQMRMLGFCLAASQERGLHPASVCATSCTSSVHQAAVHAGLRPKPVIGRQEKCSANGPRSSGLRSCCCNVTQAFA